TGRRLSRCQLLDEGLCGRHSSGSGWPRDEEIETWRLHFETKGQRGDTPILPEAAVEWAHLIGRFEGQLGGIEEHTELLGRNGPIPGVASTSVLLCHWCITLL